MDLIAPHFSFYDSTYCFYHCANWLLLRTKIRYALQEQPQLLSYISLDLHVVSHIMAIREHKMKAAFAAIAKLTCLPKEVGERSWCKRFACCVSHH